MNAIQILNEKQEYLVQLLLQPDLPSVATYRVNVFKIRALVGNFPKRFWEKENSISWLVTELQSTKLRVVGK